ncbi:MAG: Cell division protein DivIB [Oscillospiraceae bacterium]|jgi:cell division protein FtsQ
MKNSKNPRYAARTENNRTYKSARRATSAPAPSRASIRAANRRRRRRRALLIFYIVLFLAVLSAAVAVSFTVLFQIDTIQVTGTSRYSQEEIISACGIQKGENLFLAKTKQAEQQILSQLPYIGSVKVKRQLPAKIYIEVTAAHVCGAVEYSGEYVIMGDDFRVLEVTDKLPQSCPLIEGIELKNPVAGAAAEFADTSMQTCFMEVVSALNQYGLTNITGMNFSSSSSVLVEYDGRVTINLGMPSGLDYKIRYAKALFDSGKIQDTEMGTLNLSTVEENDTAYFQPETGSS